MELKLNRVVFIFVFLLNIQTGCSYGQIKNPISSKEIMEYFVDNLDITFDEDYSNNISVIDIVDDRGEVLDKFTFWRDDQIKQYIRFVPGVELPVFILTFDSIDFTKVSSRGRMIDIYFDSPYPTDSIFLSPTDTLDVEFRLPSLPYFSSNMELRQKVPDGWASIIKDSFSKNHTCNYARFKYESMDSAKFVFVGELKSNIFNINIVDSSYFDLYYHPPR